MTHIIKIILSKINYFNSRLLIILIFLTSCSTVLVKRELDTAYGKAEVKNRISANNLGPDFLTKVKPILNNRCVVCHSCYDAPCQLKLSSHEGIDRGANKKQVYLSERLFSTEPTRLFIDAKDTKGWRDKGFFPVLNERNQNANLEGSLLYKMLELKLNDLKPTEKILPSAYDFQLDRDQKCPQIEEFKDYAKKYPLWGMPYGFPKLSDSEFQTLSEWIATGGISTPENFDYKKEIIKKWEKFFNGSSSKEKLMSRYIYEHLFLANLYFTDNKDLGYFRLVRSKTPPGQPIEIIATRRPYDPPGGVFYYRLWHEKSTLSDKIDMEYSLDDKRLKRWKDLFLDIKYSVDSLPDYSKNTAANPFKAFSAIPANSRYRFMLDQAEFTVMGFIKGPVCRGNKALNVIEDRFWVMFVNPDSTKTKEEDSFIKGQSENLRLPSEESSDALILTTWLKYSNLQKKYLKAKEEMLKQKFAKLEDGKLNLIWDGNGNNKNAALTIFRHNDSASVTKGFIGGTPKTAWLIGYTLLERIHYLLVAGFDIYGNVGHQFNSRLYMDFLRMEGEYNFLSLLPKEDRIIERNFWYREADKSILNYLSWGDKNLLPGIKFDYKTDNHKKELLDAIKSYLGKITYSNLDINIYPDPISKKLASLQNKEGEWISIMPNVALLRINNDRIYTLIRDTGYLNVATPFDENDRRVSKEDRMTVTKGIVGAYPNAFYDVSENNLDKFINAITSMESESDYSKMMDQFGMRRTNQKFWAFSDWVIDYYAKTQNGKILDYNRFENR